MLGGKSAASVPASHRRGKGKNARAVRSDWDQTGRGWVAGRAAPVFIRSCGEDQDCAQSQMACQRTALDGSLRRWAAGQVAQSFK